MKNILNQTMLYYQPTILKLSDLKETQDFFVHSKASRLWKNLNFNSELERYFSEKQLHLVRDYETKEIAGFICAAINHDFDEDKYPFDYIVIKNLKRKLKMLHRIITFIYLDADKINYIYTPLTQKAKPKPASKEEKKVFTIEDMKTNKVTYIYTDESINEENKIEKVLKKLSVDEKYHEKEEIIFPHKSL